MVGFRYKVGVKEPGKYRIALDTDDTRFGGHGRVGEGTYAG